MIRPELRDTLWRWREALSGAAVALAGLLWLTTAGAGFFQALAGLVVLAGLGIGWIGYRRVRFAGATPGPGLVQVVEGQISYFGPHQGGFVALRDLEELHLIDHGRAWLLVQAQDVPVSIPVGAEGAEALFDAFASLDGMNMPALLRALDAPDPPASQVLWRHPRLMAHRRALT